jgi:hypothetical protein
MVLSRLDSPLDRVRFAAVCTPWRAAVSTHPPRHAHPCLVLDPHDKGDVKRAYYPGDGAVLPLLTRLNETGGRCFVGCHPGGWVVYQAPLGITNVYSGAEVALPADQRRNYLTLKVTFSESPTSRGCIVAAITDKYEVVIRGLGSSPECGWTTRRFYGESVMDIAFCNGHLYCLMGKNKEVAKFEVCLDQYGALVIGAVHWLAIRNQKIMQNKYFVSQGDPDAHVVCIVELRGKLAVRRTWTFWSRDIVAPFWVVFELVGLDTDESTPQQLFKWVEVTSLGDHALFLGPTCSKAIQLTRPR